MTSKVNDKKPTKKPFYKAVLGVLGVLLLAGLGNGVWELLYRPGIGVLGRMAGAIADRMDAAVYSGAALDPTPLSSLMLLVLVLGVAGATGIIALVLQFAAPTLYKKLNPPHP